MRGRTCLGCRRVFARSELVRLVRRGGTVAIDETGHAPGRGAYLCPSRDCFEQGIRRIAGALRGAGVNPAQLREEFERFITKEG